MAQESNNNKLRVVIIGCGFGGLEAARALSGAPLDITLVERTNHHLFQPLLYQVATAGLSAPAIAAPVRHLFRKQANLTTLLGEVVSIDARVRQVQLAEGTADLYPRFGRTMEWDTGAGQAVLEAAGGRVMALDGFAEAAPLRYGKIEAGFENPHFIAWGI
ncbi:MAG: FAD-dependent oxidoreductase [Gemmatimonadetes bacterium]|nr:FAD-dependent oxidoreductase [Gemmatimonadota bacterium]